MTLHPSALAVAHDDLTYSPGRARRQAALLLVTPLLLIVLGTPFFRATDPDYWWHARTGQMIWENRNLPHSDPFSYTASGRPWVMHEWLSELLFYLVESRVGYWANAALFGLVGAATTLLVYLTCRHWDLGELPSALLMMGAYALLAPSSNVRPQAFTALLVALQAYILRRYTKATWRGVWVLPLLYVLWVNLHGGYVIGLALLGIAVVGVALSAVLHRPAPPLRPLVVITGLAVLATLANPYGVGALLYPFSYAGTGNASMRYINEWQSPDFHQAIFAPLALLIVALLAMGIARKPLGVVETAWALLLGAMSLLSARHMQLFGIVAVPLFGARAQAEFPGLRRGLADWQRPGVLAVLWPVMALLAAALLLSPRESALTRQSSRSPSSTGYPSGAVEYLREHQPRGNLFNFYAWGGYLVYELHGDYPVFIDGRADVYGDELMDAYMEVAQLEPGWYEHLQDFDISLVLVPADAPLGAVLSRMPEWETLHLDDEALLMGTTGHD